jgi:hypothetical protein
MIDAEGRLFGRVNLVDALCVLFLLGLLPLAYVSWLLFRPAVPTIRSVEPSAVTMDERRIAAGLPIRRKVKVRGEHLAPILRATIDDVPAIGFTFETPESADVIIGYNVPYGTHDLVLYDGVQEVARAPGAIAIAPPPAAMVHAIGALTQLDEAHAKGLRAGQRFDVDGHTIAEIIALGSVEPDRTLVHDGARPIEAPTTGWWRRDAIVAMPCEPDPDAPTCHVGDAVVSGATAAVVDVPGASPALRMRVSGIVPPEAPRTAAMRVRIGGHPELAGLVRAGDRDARWPAIDARAAVVSTVARTTSGDGFEIVVRLGVERGAGGWRYHGQALEPGTAWSLVTDRYALAATIVSVVIDER